MTHKEKINVMATYLWDLGAGDWWEHNDASDLPMSITYDEPTGSCDGSQWVRHELTCSATDWAEAMAVEI